MNKKYIEIEIQCENQIRKYIEQNDALRDLIEKIKENNKSEINSIKKEFVENIVKNKKSENI